jgi:hypothetical protein
LLFEGFLFLAALGSVKENSGCRRTVSLIRQILAVILQSRSLLKNSCQFSGVSRQQRSAVALSIPLSAHQTEILPLLPFALCLLISPLARALPHTHGHGVY